MLGSILRVIKQAKRGHLAKKFLAPVPFNGFQDRLNKIKFVDYLSDADLMELNNALQWNCFTVDSHGRRFGNSAWEEKRCDPQVIPDPRIVLMDAQFGLFDKHVLEVGCFEGIHTVGLAMFARRVTAIDSRVENVVKTIVRSAMFGYTPTVFKYNLEDRPINLELLSADVLHHVGVLYHLRDPVTHLLEVGQYIRRGLILDSHYCLEHEAREDYEVNGKQYFYKMYKESDRGDVFSGMYDHSKWLRLNDIIELLGESGFGRVKIVETRNERNGPRVLLMAERS